MSKHMRVMKAFTLKGRMMPYSQLCVHSLDIDALELQLLQQLSCAPDLLPNMKIFLNFDQLDQLPNQKELTNILLLLKRFNICPIAVENLDPKAYQGLSLSFVKKMVKTVAAKSNNLRYDYHIIDHTIRTGQQICVEDAHLIIFGSVNQGSEIMAGGNIHIYGTLSGRAMAGVKGDRNVRIFTQQLQADLIAISGVFTTYHQLPESMVNKGGVCIHLNEGELIYRSI